MTDIETPATTDFRRDRWGRPLIVPPEGGKPIAYTRASGATKEITDRYNIERWGNRNVAYGMAADPSLVARLIALGGTPSTWSNEQRNAANKIVDDAQQAALAHKAADIGTAIHRIIERAVKGEEVAAGPYQQHLDTFWQIVADHRWELSPEYCECRLVCDELHLAGTADFIVHDPTHGWCIADLKTGRSVDYAALDYAGQLACYAHSMLYDVATDHRLPTPPINPEIGFIIHIPAEVA